MNFDDTARFFGPSHKLWPELFRGERHDRDAKRLCLGPGHERGGNGFKKCRVQVFGRHQRCEKCQQERENAKRRLANLV